MRGFTSASVEYNRKILLSWNNGNHMEELPDIFLLWELCFPNKRSKKSNSKSLLSSCFAGWIKFINEFAWIRINFAQLTELGGRKKSKEVHVFLQTHSLVRCECMISQKKKKNPVWLLREGAKVMKMSLWSRDQPAILPGWSLHFQPASTCSHTPWNCRLQFY